MNLFGDVIIITKKIYQSLMTKALRTCLVPWAEYSRKNNKLEIFIIKRPLVQDILELKFRSNWSKLKLESCKF